VGPIGESPFWKLRDWLLCNESLFASFEELRPELDRSPLLPSIGNEKEEFDELFEADKFVTDEFAELVRNA